MKFLLTTCWRRVYCAPKWVKVGEDGICVNKAMSLHAPVMADEIVTWLPCRPGGKYVDCTVGYGGHGAQIAARSEPGGVFIGIDQDADAVDAAREQFQGSRCEIHIVKGNFSQLQNLVHGIGLVKVDGIMFDLGVSSPQIDRPERGFSFSVNGPLDMRMDRSARLCAADLVNGLSETELAGVIYQQGEERYSRRIARAIVRVRQASPLRTTHDLVSVIEQAVPPAYRRGRIHCATRTFQALRIAVNHELDVLEPALRQAADLLAPGGRMCVLSFHSLEDRIVKHTLRALSKGPEAKLSVLTKKPQVPSDEECRRNPRARSAKLRVAEHL